MALGRTFTPDVAKTAEKAGQILYENGFDGRPDVGSRTLLDRVETGLLRQ
jgi:hypothetical protein